MKEMTLRVRGETEVRKMLRTKNRLVPAVLPEADALQDESSDGFDMDEPGEDVLTAADLVDEDSDDNVSLTSIESDRSHNSTRGAVVKARSNTKLPTVIEDSDADVIDLLSD